MTSSADHQDHNVVPHDHSGQNTDRKPWCKGRYLCLTCRTEDLPRGVWFTGDKCAAPKAGKAA